jgi:hypothetical protein
MPTTDFPRAPKLQKGALAVYPKHDAGTAPSRVITFQYNPDSLKRTLADRAAPPKKGNVGAAKEDVLRVQGPPIETISVTIELDATEQLEHPDENDAVARHGLHPAIATLELLMYPPSLTAQKMEQLSQQGKAQISPADLPLILFVWGPSRVVPVDVTSFSISEEAFDPRLNPIRAKVELALRVLTYMELPLNSLGRDAFNAYQHDKENRAAEHTSTGDTASVPNAKQTVTA